MSVFQRSVSRRRNRAQSRRLFLEQLEDRRLLAILPPSGMVAWYRAESAAGNVAVDHVGGHNGTFTGGALLTTGDGGKVGEAFLLDGLNDQISIPDSADWEFGSDDFTIDLWVNLNTVAETQILVGNNEFVGTGWQFRVDSGNMQFVVNDGGGDIVIDSGVTLSTGVWQHVAVVRSGGAGSYTFFLNGAAAGSGNDFNAIPNPSAQLTIGGAAGVNFLSGRIDEVEIFNRALSGEEIQSIYAADSEGKATIIVTNTNDAGAGSLRAAFTAANTNAGQDVIGFNIPGGGVHVISLAMALPALTGRTIIDGFTQEGSTPNTNPVGDGLNAALAIEINGSGVTGDGVVLQAANSAVRGLVVRGFNGVAINAAAGATGSVIAGNYIGTDATGTTALPNADGGVAVSAANVRIGGTQPAARNLISNSGGPGIEVSAANAIIQGNLIGTDASGSMQMGNGGLAGVVLSSSGALLGGAVAGAGNLISANSGSGVHISGNGNLVQGNVIGTDFGGGANLGNDIHGVLIIGAASNNTIGGTAAGAGNVIAFNQQDGIEISGTGTGNAILGNSIYDNGLMGIDLAPDGVNPNDPAPDADTGPNNLQNYPVITSAVTTSMVTTIEGTLTSAFNTTYRVELFASPAADDTGFGEGRTFLGFVNVTTNGTGAANFTFPSTAIIVPSGQVITATATDPGNNTSEFSQAFTVVPGAPEADLQITKSSPGNSFVVGSPITYTITVMNAGPSDVMGAVVADTFPMALLNVMYTSVAAGGASGNDSGMGHINDTVNMPAGSTITYTVNATIDPLAPLGPLVNTATVTAPDGVTDLVPANNTATETDTLTGPQADLSITKTNGVNSVEAGSTFQYTIVVSNAGPSGVTGATVQDTFPLTLLNVTYTSTTTGGATGNTAMGNGHINDSVTMPSGSTITYIVTATVDPAATPGTNLVNTATVMAPGTVNDPVPGNNTATDTDNITGPQADLSITKTDGRTTAVPGTAITYTIVVSNPSSHVVTGATVTDTFDSRFSSVTWTTSSLTGATSTPPSASGNINASVNLPAGSTITYTVTAMIRPDATGTLSNTAMVMAPGTITDPNAGNNTATDNNTVLTPRADLQIDKTNNVTSVVAGDTVVYMISVANLGPSTAVGATIADAFDPSFFSSVSFTSVASPGVVGNTPAGNGNISDTVTLPPDGEITYIVTATVNIAASGTISNTATITAPPGVDPDPTNNSSTDMDTIVEAASDLRIVKNVGSMTVVPGGPIMYQIIVTNDGPSAANGAVITDTFPPALVNVMYISASTLGATGHTSGMGNINDTVNMPPGSTITYTVTATVSPSAAAGPLANTAIVMAPPSPPAPPDPDTTNNTSTAITTVELPVADLQVTKTNASAQVVAGGPVSYTIVVTNAGPSPVTGASVVDNFPASLSGITFTAAGTGGAAGFSNGAGNINQSLTLPAGATVTYIVSATLSLTATGTLSNTVTVMPPPGVSDPSLPNMATRQNTILPPQADLQITKTNGVTEVTPGNNVTYTIVVTNAGPLPVNGAVVSDFLPSQLLGATFTSSAAGGASGNTSGSGNIQNTVNLPVGATITYTVTGALDLIASGVLINTATVSPPAGFVDPNPGNNSASDVDTILPLTMGFTAVGANAAPGVQPVVNIYSAAGVLVESFLAYGASFRGGVRVAMGDVNGDGVDDVITAPGRGGSPVVKVFDGTTLTDGVMGNATELVGYRIMAYGSKFTGGVFVAVGDVTGDGRNDIVVAPGREGTAVKGPKNGGTEIRVFQNNSATNPAAPFASTPTKKFLAFPANTLNNVKFLGGASVAVGDVVPGGKQEIIVGSGPGIRAQVRVFDIQGTTPVQTHLLTPFVNSFKGGVLVEAAHVNGDGYEDIIIAAGQGGGSKVEIRSGNGGMLIRSLTLFSGDAKTVNPAAAISVVGKDLNGDGIVDQMFASQGTDGRYGKLRRFSPLSGPAVDFILGNGGFLG